MYFLIFINENVGFVGIINLQCDWINLDSIFVVHLILPNKPHAVQDNIRPDKLGFTCCGQEKISIITARGRQNKCLSSSQLS